MGALPSGFTEVSTIAVASAMYDTPAQTNSQTVSGIWSTADQYAKYLFLRGNSDFTTYMYVKLQSNTPQGISGTPNCEIGCVVAGVRTVLDTFALPLPAEGPGVFLANQNYQCEATDYTFTVTGPGGLNHSFTDSSHISQMSADYVYGGFGTDGWARDDKSFSQSEIYSVSGWAVTGTLFDIGAEGNGGPAWTFARLQYGTDVPLTTDSFSVTMGGSGAATTVAIDGYGDTPITSPGGTATDIVSAVFNNNAFVAFGSGVVPPQARIIALDISLPGSMYSWSFFDSGPVAGPAAGYVATQEKTTTATYADLTTPGPEVTVNIGPSGLAMVFIYGDIYGSGTNVGWMGFQLSGANTQAADDSYAIMQRSTTSSQTLDGTIGAPFLLTELASGATTFEAKYRTNGTASFQYRRIAVIPL